MLTKHAMCQALLGQEWHFRRHRINSKARSADVPAAAVFTLRALLA